MRFLKRSARHNPKVSLILLDWSVRDSFHLLHYLERQDVPRDTFEVLVVEYYSRVSEAIRKFEDRLDTWLLLEMPEDCYYHKHVMYNAGIVLARGDICVICDSDAMVKPGFLRAIVEAFDRDPTLVLHLDQFRNNRRDFYPFNYPNFEEVEGEGCINNAGGKTVGILDRKDPIHSRNYGACMCARRSDLIAIGGADEYVDFVGHICGPYDMTFRLVNHGRKELWHPSEFMYHTWHPGQAGVDNYLGPHDGHHLSTTSLAALSARRVRPLLENPAIRRLREHPDTAAAALLDQVIRPEGPSDWQREKLEGGCLVRRMDEADLHVGFHKGYTLYRHGKIFSASLSINEHRGHNGPGDRSVFLEAPALEEIRLRIDTEESLTAVAIALFTRAFAFAWLAVGHVVRRARRGLLEHGAAGSGTSASLRQFAGRIRYRFTQFAVQGRILAEGLLHLAPNLKHAGRLVSETGDVSLVKVLVDSRRAETYLRLLRALGAIPRVQLERVDDSAQFGRILNDAAADASGTRLVVSRDLYARYYPDAFPMRDRLGLVVL